MTGRVLAGCAVFGLAGMLLPGSDHPPLLLAGIVVAVAWVTAVAATRDDR